jgi:Rieske Fe-S protein
MADIGRGPGGPVDPAITSPAREGLTGTTPANLYAASPQREQITIPPDFTPVEAQPAWRQDFPIDWPQDAYIERRDFMKFMVLTSAAFTAGQFWIAARNWYRKRVAEPLVRRIASTGDVAVGQAMTFAYPDAAEPCVLVRVSPTEIVAFNQKCTHLSCAVIPRPRGQLHLPLP